MEEFLNGTSSSEGPEAQGAIGDILALIKGDAKGSYKGINDISSTSVEIVQGNGYRGSAPITRGSRNREPPAVK